MAKKSGRKKGFMERHSGGILAPVGRWEDAVYHNFEDLGKKILSGGKTAGHDTASFLSKPLYQHVEDLLGIGGGGDSGSTSTGAVDASTPSTSTDTLSKPTAGLADLVKQLMAESDPNNPNSQTNPPKPPFTISPEQAQMFMEQTALPGLKDLTNQMTGEAMSYSNQANQALSQVTDPLAHSILATAIPQQQADTNNLARSFEASARAGPVFKSVVDSMQQYKQDLESWKIAQQTDKAKKDPLSRIMDVIDIIGKLKVLQKPDPNDPNSNPYLSIGGIPKLDKDGNPVPNPNYRAPSSSNFDPADIISALLGGGDSSSTSTTTPRRRVDAATAASGGSTGSTSDVVGGEPT